MPWIGPDRRSCLEAFRVAPLLRPFAAGVEVFPAGRAVAGRLRLAVFFTDFLPDFLLLADFVDGLAVFFRAAGFPALFADFLLCFFVAFFLSDFFDADFFAAFFADFPDVAGFLRAADFFFDAFFFDTFFFDAFFVGDFLALTLRFLPAAFLLAVDFRDAVVFLPVPARFCFLLAAFFAGMFHSCRSEKNAELYIGCRNMEPYLNRIFPGFGTLSRPLPAAFPDSAVSLEGTRHKPAGQRA